MAITYSVRIIGGGTVFFHGFEYFGLITLASREFRVLLAVLPASLFVHFWLRQCRMVLRPHLYCLPSRFTLVRSLYWVLGLCGISPGCCCVGAACTDDSSAGSSASLAQCCRCGGFFPNSAIFSRELWGLLFLLRNFCDSASIPWLRFWCSLLCSICLFSAYLYPTVASLVGFSCGPPSLVVAVCVCVWGFFQEYVETCLFT